MKTIYDDLIEEDQSELGGQQAQPPAPDPIREERDRQQRTIQVNMAEATKTSPDRAADVRRLSLELGQPPEVIERNYDHFAAADQATRSPWSAVMKNHPPVAAFLQNPNNAAIAHDDLDNLSFIDWVVRGGPEMAVLQGIAQQDVARLQWQKIQTPGGLSPADQLELKGAQLRMKHGGELGTGQSSWYDPKVWVKGAAGLLPMVSEGLIGGAIESATTIPTMVGVGAAYGAATGVPIAVPALMSAGFTAGVATAGVKQGFVLETGLALDEFEQLKDEKGQLLDPGVAMMAALAAGTVNAGLEAGILGVVAKPFQKLLQPVLGKTAGREAVKFALRSPTVRAALLNLAKEWGKDVAKESAMEAGQRAVTIMGREIGKWVSGRADAMTPAIENIGDVAGEFVGAITSMGLVQLPGSFVDSGPNFQRARQASQNQEFFEALATGVTESKTNQRSSEAFKEFVASATKDGPVENLYIDVNRFEEYFQSQGADPAAVATEVTGNPNAFQEAKDHQRDLKIATADYAAKLAGTEHNAALYQDIRLQGPESWTLRQQKVWAADLEAKTFEDQVQRAEVREQLTAQITAAIADTKMKTPPSWVESNVEAVANFYETQAVRHPNAGTALELMQAHLAQVQGPTGEVAAAPDALVTETAPAAQTELAQGDAYRGPDDWFAALEQPPAAAAPTPVSAGEVMSPSAAETLTRRDIIVEGVTLPTGGAETAQARRVVLSPRSEHMLLAAPGRPVSQQAGRIKALLADPETNQKKARAMQAALKDINANRIPAPPREKANQTFVTQLEGRPGTVNLQKVKLLPGASVAALTPEHIAALQAEGFDGAQDETGEVIAFEPEKAFTPIAPGTTVEEFFQKEVDPYARADMNKAPARRVNGRLRLSTRVPWGVDAEKRDDVLTTRYRDVVLEEERFGGDWKARATALLRGTIPALKNTSGVVTPYFGMVSYPMLSASERANLNDDEVVARLNAIMVENLRWLYDLAKAGGWADRAKLWYVGAHKIAGDMADELGLSIDQTAAILACLSPQMDWFKNVDLGFRVARIWKRMQAENPVFDEAWFDTYRRRTLKLGEFEKPRKKPLTPGQIAKAKFKRATKEALIDAERRLHQGKRWRDLDNDGQALFLREIDEKENPRHYRIVTPEGGYGDFKRNKPKKKGALGEPAKVGWGGYAFIANAISVLNDGSEANIHYTVGGEHKVRSFFNNISDPWWAGSWTGDTHAVAAQLLMPLAGTSWQVDRTMKGTASAYTGLSGINALMAEPYFQLAEELNILPRELQSITWEMVRLLFPSEIKGTAQTAIDLYKNVHGLWEQRAEGKITIDGFRSRLLEAVKLLDAEGKARQPDWVAPVSQARGEQRELPAGDGATGRSASGSGDQGPSPERHTGRVAGGRDGLHRGVWRRLKEGDGHEAADAEADAENEEEFNQESERQPDPIFYSRLEAAVRDIPLTSAPGLKWKGIIRKWAKAKPTPSLHKSWLEGIDQMELALANIDELEDGRTYTKTEVLQYVLTRKVVATDVILGAPLDPELQTLRDERVIERTEAIFDNDVDNIFERIMDRQEPPLAAADVDEETGVWYAYVDGETDGEEYETSEEAERAAERAADAALEEREERAREQALEEADYGEARDQAERDIDEQDMREGEDFDRVFFEKWSEPGYEEKSYREVFVTAEALPPADVDPAVLGALEDEYRIVNQTARLARDVYVQASSAETVAYDRYLRKRNDAPPSEVNAAYDEFLKLTDEKTEAGIAKDRAELEERNVRTRLRVEQEKQGPQQWEDGHGDYDNIERPIVRLRFNTRMAYLTDAEGNTTTYKTLFLEELQPPKPEQQKAMPPVLLKHWREIGMKWALRYAADHGFQAVAWTNGEMQRKRYGLARHVEAIQWQTQPGKIGRQVKILTREGNTYYADVDSQTGEVIDSRGGGNWQGEQLSAVIGEEVAKQILDADQGVVKDVDLEVGGRGLKKLYDVDFPAVVNSLQAVRRTAERVAKKRGPFVHGDAPVSTKTKKRKGPATTVKDSVQMFQIDRPGKGGTFRVRPVTTTHRRVELYQTVDQATQRAVLVGNFAGDAAAREEALRLIEEEGVDIADFAMFGKDETVTTNWAVDDPAGHFQRQFATRELADAYVLERQKLVDQEVRAAGAVPGIVMTEALVNEVLGGQALLQEEEGPAAPAEPVVAEPKAADEGKPRGKYVAPGKKPKKFGSIRRLVGGKVTELLGDRRLIIRLFQDADASTFIHEAAHMFLEVLRTLEMKEGETASPQAKQDMAILREWFFGPGGEGTITTAQHEKFARGFERYMLEGKAPSLKLRGVMRRFRGWMLQLYGAAQGLNVELTDDVRGVFDRMLATDEAIAQAQNEFENTPMFLTPESAGYTAAQFALYETAIAEASLTSRETLEARLLQDMRKAQTSQYRAQEEETKAEVTAEVHAQPVYQALSAMQRGTKPDGTPLDPDAPAEPLKLSKAILVDRYGVDRLRQLPRSPAFIYSAEGGLDPDVVAPMFGYASGDAMLQAVQKATPMAQAIKAETAKRMQERYGDLVLEGRVPDEARAALANEQRDAIIRAELRALAKLRLTAAPFVKAGEAQLAAERQERAYERRWFDAERKLEVAQAKGAKQEEIDKLEDEAKEARARARGGAATIRAAIPPMEVIRDTARARIGLTRVRDLQPDLFWAAAKRESTKATEKAAKGDYDGAIIAKQNELINLAMYRYATMALKDADKRVKRAQGYTLDRFRARIGLAGYTYLDQIDGLLDRYDFARVSQKALDRRADLAKWAQGIESTGQPVNIPESMLKEARRINYRELTYDELKDVTDTLKQIAHLAGLKNRLLQMGRARDAQVVKEDVAASIRESSDRKTPSRFGHRLPQNENARLVSMFFAAHRKLAEVVARMDSYADGGKVWEAIMRPLNKAADREATLRAEASKALGDLIKDAYPGLEKGRLYVQQHFDVLGDSMTPMEIIGVAFQWGNKDGRQRLAGMGITEVQARVLFDTLDERDWQFINGVVAHLDSYWDQVAAKEQRVTGLAPEKVEALPFDTKFGEQPGGYFPIKYEDRSSGKAIAKEAATAASLQMAAAYSHATTRRGHTKARLENVEDAVRLDFGVMFEHVDQVIHDLSHHEALIDVGRILGSDEVRTAIMDAYGEVTYKSMLSTVKAIADGTVPPVHAGEKAFNYLRTGAVIAGLGWNVVTSALQPFGLTQSMSRIGIGWVGRGIGRWVMDGFQMENSVAWIHDRSEFMRNRGRTQQREINEALNAVYARTGKVSGVIEEVLMTVTRDTVTQQGIVDSYFWLIQKMQMVADVPTWLGQYEKSLEAGESEERAVELADQAVIDAQGSGYLKDLAEIQRGPASWKLWTAYYSFFNTLYNQTSRAQGRSQMNNPAAIGRLAVDHLLLFIVPASLGFMLKEAMRGEDDEEHYWFRLARENVAYAMGTMVGLREMSGFAQDYFGYEGPAGARAFGTLTKLGKQVLQFDVDENLIKSLNDSAGILMQYPSSAVWRFQEGLRALAQGVTQNPLAPLVGLSQDEKKKLRR